MNRICIFAVALTAVRLHAADPMPASEQTALVHKYCAVCHTDAAANGGLSLQHFDAAHAAPSLSAMLLSKMTHGAMGAAGMGIPDKPTIDALIQATAANAVGATEWYVQRSGE